MGDWAQLAQSVILGLIFSYLLAKLISIVVTFKEDNLSLTRHPEEPQFEIKSEGVDSRRLDSSSGGGGEADSLVAEQGSSRSDSVAGDDSEDDDDWEGVESTELDEAFSAATLFVTTAASDRLSQKVPSDVQQQLYGLYKIATEGPCTAPQPSALKMTARAKWYISSRAISFCIYFFWVFVQLLEIDLRWKFEVFRFFIDYWVYLDIT